MKLYCFDIIMGIAIATFVFIAGGFTILKATEDTTEEKLLNSGYVKTNYTQDQLMYTDFEECVEYKNKFYCY